MLAPSTAGFAAASLPPMLAYAAATANTTHCFGLAVLAIVAALPTVLAHLFAVLTKSPAVALHAQPLFDAMGTKRTSSAFLAFISHLAMMAKAAAAAILAPVAPPPMLTNARALAHCATRLPAIVLAIPLPPHSLQPCGILPCWQRPRPPHSLQ